MIVQTRTSGRSIRPPPEVDLQRVKGTYVRFLLGVESYALPVTHLNEVAILRELTVVPGVQPALIGVWSLRGQILPVVDLADLLALGRSAQPKYLLVVELDGQQIGLAVDEVNDVEELEAAVESRDSELVATVVTGNADGLLIGILDVRRLFDVLLEGASG